MSEQIWATIGKIFTGWFICSLIYFIGIVIIVVKELRD